MITSSGALSQVRHGSQKAFECDAKRQFCTLHEMRRVSISSVNPDTAKLVHDDSDRPYFGISWAEPI